MTQEQTKKIEELREKIAQLNTEVSSLKNDVADMSAKTREQEKKIRDAKIKYIVCALDNDSCGRKGYEYLKSIFPDRVIRWKYLKGIKDNGEATKETFTKMYDKTMQELNSLLNKNTKEN